MLGEKGQMSPYYLSIGLGFILVVFFFLSKSNLKCLSLINLIRLRKRLQKQGLKGPPPSLLHGNDSELQKIAATSRPWDDGVVSHDFVPNLFPYFHQWRKEYGKVYIYTLRQKQHLYVSSPELVREMSQNMSTDLGRPTYLSKQLYPLFGNGVGMANRLLWTRQRKIVSPEFYMEKINSMVGLMWESSEFLVEKWESVVADGGGGRVEVRVDEDLRIFTADVIARACFGSSYVKGKQIFSKLRSLSHTLSSNGRFIIKDSRRFGIFRREREIKRLEKEVNDLIWDTVQEKHNEADTQGLMHILLQSSDYGDVNVGDGKNNNKDLIIDNCKNIYFAGHESTTVTTAWCLVLLASYPDWQTRLRQEILQVDQPPTLDALNKMKSLNMFIQEVLRLYSPAPFLAREALQDVRLGDLIIPEGVYVYTNIAALHRDPELWGSDALDFKPERFADGVAKACKIPQAYIPFGLGPRSCLGKNFAIIEIKIALSRILSAFTFSLSENYRHSPTFTMVIEPPHGVYLLMEKNTY